MFWIEQKKIQCQTWFMNEKSQKWINSIPIEALGHGEDKSKHGFHGSMVMNENRATMHMNINFIFQISNNLLNYFIWDKVHQLQHGRNYTWHSIIWKNKEIENSLDLEKIDRTVLFEWFQLKQRSTMLGDVECLKLFGSMLLGDLQSSICHWKSLVKTEQENAVTARK